MSTPKPKSTYTPPDQQDLKPTPILDDAEDASTVNKRRATRQTLKATYLTAPSSGGSGVSLP
jgi:hypothetical protein